MSEAGNRAPASPARMAIEWAAIYAVAGAVSGLLYYSSPFSRFLNPSQAVSFTTAATACVFSVAFGLLGWRGGLDAARAWGVGALKLAITLMLSGAPAFAREIGIPFAVTAVLLSIATVPISLFIFAEFDRRLRDRRLVLTIAPPWMIIIGLRGWLPSGVVPDFVHGYAAWAILQALFFAHLGYSVASRPAPPGD